jgi:hypothetical protein
VVYIKVLLQYFLCEKLISQNSQPLGVEPWASLQLITLMPVKMPVQLQSRVIFIFPHIKSTISPEEADLQAWRPSSKAPGHQTGPPFRTLPCEKVSSCKWMNDHLTTLLQLQRLYGVQWDG